MGESHTNLLGDTWKAMNGSGVWEESWWSLTFRTPLFPLSVDLGGPRI